MTVASKILIIPQENYISGESLYFRDSENDVYFLARHLIQANYVEHTLCIIEVYLREDILL